MSKRYKKPYGTYRTVISGTGIKPELEAVSPFARVADITPQDALALLRGDDVFVPCDKERALVGAINQAYGDIETFMTCIECPHA